MSLSGPHAAGNASFIDVHGARLDVSDYEAGRQLYFKRGWTDGQPILLPTRGELEERLNGLGWSDEEAIGDGVTPYPSVSLGEVVIHAIMAGCEARDLPVLRAALEAMLAPDFRPDGLIRAEPLWPYFVVNGPIVTDLRLNYDQYMMGPAGKANSTIARAISLVAWNILNVRPKAAQHSAFGCPWRSESVLAERPDGPWPQLHEDRGFRREDSTVTAFPVAEYESILVHLLDGPEHILGTIVDSLNMGRFVWGPHLLILPPNMVAVFNEAGWTKSDVRDYIVDNSKRSIAGLKRRTRWAAHVGADSDTVQRLLSVTDGDHDKMVYLFKRQAEFSDLAFPAVMLREREAEVYIINAGGDSGPVARVLSPASESTGVPHTTRLAARDTMA